MHVQNLCSWHLGVPALQVVREQLTGLSVQKVRPLPTADAVGWLQDPGRPNCARVLTKVDCRRGHTCLDA